MGTPYLSQIALFSFNFPPKGWAFCNGQLLPINQNQALFALLGTTYGGNGTTTFALPDLRGRAPMGVGGGHILGEVGGTEAVTLGVTQMPAHTHALDISGLTASARCKNGVANQRTPVAGVPAIEVSVIPPFTDDPLTAGSTMIRAVHITELRTRINALRARVNLGAFVFTDPSLSSGTTMVRAQHIQELRTALLQAYASAGLTPPTFTDAALAAGSAIKAVHVAELRSAVSAADAVTFGKPYSNAAPDANMNSGAIVMGGAVIAATAGLNQLHENRMPHLALTYCIALQGIFPSQT
jgi:microcystin-dependent protein